MPQPRSARLKNTLCFGTFTGEQKYKSRIRESKKMIRKVRTSTHLRFRCLMGHAIRRCLGAQHIVSRKRKDDEAYARPRQVPVHRVVVRGNVLSVPDLEHRLAHRHGHLIPAAANIRDRMPRASEALV